MTRKHISAAIFAAALSMGAATPAHAVIGYADSVVDFFDSGAGPMAGPYGGTFPGAFPVSVSTSVVLGPDGAIADFLSLPTGSYVTVAFLDELVVDGVGNDIFIEEVGASGETANIFVTKDFVTYTFLGLANDAIVTAFDLSSIGWVGNVAGVRIVGLDALGGSPGFDVANVQALPSAIRPVPEPSTWAMMLFGFAVIGRALRRRTSGRRSTAIV
jgi:PEP-CTERM motif